MNKPLAVLLLRIAGAPDQPTKAYADRLFTSAGKGTRNLVDYYDEMSHGRHDLSASKVFDWIDYGHTLQDIQDAWTKAKNDKKKELLDAGVAEAKAEKDASVHANGERREQIKTWAKEAATKAGFNLAPYDPIVCVFNQLVDYFGSAGMAVLNWNPANNHRVNSVDLTGVSHEVGHALGLPTHSRLDGSAAEYGDKWDILSAYSVHFDDSGTMTPPGSPYYTFGPGLNAANMDMAGWLDPTRVLHVNASLTFQLRPLHRRDLPGWLAARVQLGYETFYLEFRVREGWDTQIPAHCLLLHRKTTHPINGRPCSEMLMASTGASTPRPDLRQGESYETGDKLDPFGFYTKITLTQVDSETRTAFVNVMIRQRRPVEPSGIQFGGVTVDGGGWVWTPGKGFVKVPPRSPLLGILESLAEFEVLQSLQASGRGGAVEELTLDRLVAARNQLTTLIQARAQANVPGPVLEIQKSE